METEDEFLNSFSERYRHCDFLYTKNEQHKVVELEFEKTSSFQCWPIVDILQFDCKNLKLEEDMRRRYEK